MKTAFAVIAILTLCILTSDCNSQMASNAQSVGGDFGKDWISSFKAQNPQPSKQNLENDLWSWGSAPKGSIIVNGNLVPDPYYIWKSLNYTTGWLGKVYTDPSTGYPVYGYVDPYTGNPIYYYIDPSTGKPVYTYGYPSYGYPYYDSSYYSGLPYDFSSPYDYSLPPNFGSGNVWGL